MKIRNGFVSNSSSSSFIVAVKCHSDTCPTCRRKDPDFLYMVSHMGDSSGFNSTRVNHRTVQNIRDKWGGFPSYLPEGRENEEKSSLFELMVDAEHKGYEVAYINISYNDHVTTEMMDRMEETKNVVVLWSDHRDIEPKNIKL